MKTRAARWWLAMTLNVVAVALPRAEDPLPRRQSRLLMGTLCEVQAYHADAAAADRAVTAALDEMQRVDRLLSNYDPSSELSAMNREASRGAFRASPELFAFVESCARYVRASEGSFDPTVGPLVRAWGFLTPRPQQPSSDAIAAARARTGFGRVRLDAAARTVSFAVDGMEIDPGGIGKGYAVDAAVRALRRHGIASALVSAGGSTISAIGRPPGRDGWTIAVRNPHDVDAPFAFVTLRDNALSTSGVSEKSVVSGTRRYSHLFDPRSGEPVEGMCQATVVAPTATESDALTKPAFVLDRAGVLRVFAPGGATHALRVEGDCAAPRAVWITPWSTAVWRYARQGRVRSSFRPSSVLVIATSSRI